ncbi:MAG TPA: hypothetical protein VLM40_13290, partial [Gemmata sp.]|nr:hypothetical protein [Gemmata sp.]
MKSKPVSSIRQLSQLFRCREHKRRWPLLAVEQLCDRVVPTVWNVTTTADKFDFVGALSLREAIFNANQDADTTQVINLVGGSTYTLSIANTTGQENADAEGDLDIVDQGGVAGTKTYQIVGAGAGAVIDQTVIDRVFQIIGADPADLAVVFNNVTIQDGTAIDNGTALTVGGTTALGGGVLNQGGGNVSFTNAVVQNNTARADDGAAGANGTVSGAAGGSGLAGFDAFGGAVFSTGGTITLTTSQFKDNKVVAGDGGDGGDGSDGIVVGGAGGAGGAGGNAAGAGIYALSGDVVVDNGSSVSTNTATAGDG